MNLYDKVGAAQGYDAARSLPEDSMRLWIEEFRCALPRPPQVGVLDLGCGTGRFAEGLRQEFGCRVVGVDPSESMLEQARSRPATGVEWAPGSATSIPLPDASIDLVFMSQVYHHIQDKEAAFREIRRVLSPGGILLIRNGTQECTEGVLWLQCFPRAAEIDRARMPRRAELIAEAQASGLLLVSQKMVSQVFATSHQEYVEKIGKRGLSALIAISDSEFHEGMETLRRTVRELPADSGVSERIDLFCFQR